MENKEKCKHEIGRKVIGGFPGHEHVHPTGNQLCLNCNKYLSEIFEEIRREERERIRSLYWPDMVDILDVCFPKGKCAERGKASVMLAYINMLLKGYFLKDGKPVKKI